MSEPWWSKKWGKNAICGITMTRLRPGKDKHGIDYVTTLECKHRFYTNALFKWINLNFQHPTCPMCRKDICKIKYGNYYIHFNTNN